MTYAKAFSLFLCLGLAACATSSEDLDKARALNAQGKVLLAQGKNAEARDIYLSSVSRDDENARTWNGLGASYDLLGKRDDAKDAYLHARELAPNDPMVANNLAHLYLETGDAAAAVEVLTPFARDPKASPVLMQNFAKAVKAAPKKKPDVASSYAELGIFPTEGQAQGHLMAIKSLVDKPEAYTFAVVPELKIAGGTPVFSVRATGEKLQDLCDDVFAKAVPCIVHKNK
jgi:Flp pilus assembly protein TadD